MKAIPLIYCAILALGFPVHAQVPDLRINEVMASNGSTIADEDGDYEDWIELYNAGETAVDLSGWGLSDNEGNPFKWVFPEGAAIRAESYLLVWASGKDKVVKTPDWEFEFGFGSEWRYLDGGAEVGEGWTEVEFDDSGWQSGAGAFGYGVPPVEVETELDFGEDAGDKVVTHYLRKTVDLEDVDSILALSARLRTDAGAVIYVNGEEVARHDMPGGVVTPGTFASPVDFEGLSVWLAADAQTDLREVGGTQYVTEWGDLSGHGRDAVQVSEAKQPRLLEDRINGMPAIRFDGEGRVLSTEGFATGGEVTVFMVGRFYGSHSSWATALSKRSMPNGFIVQRQGNSDPYQLRIDTGIEDYANQRHVGGNLFTGDPVSLAVQIEGSRRRAFLNGSLDFDSTFDLGSGIGNSASLRVGASSATTSNSVDADIAEVIFYNRALSSDERLEIERYLNHKYGFSVQTVEYVLEPENFVEGENVVAVEVHRREGSSPNLFFGMEMEVGLETVNYHTNYQISSEGEEVLLTDPDGNTVDFMEPVAMPRDVSYGGVWRIPKTGSISLSRHRMD